MALPLHFHFRPDYLTVRGQSLRFSVFCGAHGSQSQTNKRFGAFQAVSKLESLKLESLKLESRKLESLGCLSPEVGV